MPARSLRGSQGEQTEGLGLGERNAAFLGERERGGERDGPVQAVHLAGEVFVGDGSAGEGGADQAREILEGDRDRAEVADGRLQEARERPAGREGDAVGPDAQPAAPGRKGVDRGVVAGVRGGSQRAPASATRPSQKGTDVRAPTTGELPRTPLPEGPRMELPRTRMNRSENHPFGG